MDRLELSFIQVTGIVADILSRYLKEIFLLFEIYSS